VTGLTCGNYPGLRTVREIQSVLDLCDSSFVLSCSQMLEQMWKSAQWAFGVEGLAHVM
jgi:hypothetical protein